MKTAQEFAKIWSLNNNNDEIDKQDFLAAVKEIQEDAYNQAIKDAAENAELSWDFEHGTKLDKQSILNLLK